VSGLMGAVIVGASSWGRAALPVIGTQDGGPRLSAGHGHWIDIRALERLSTLESPFHRVHPAIKLVVTLVFTALVASFPASAVTPLVAMGAYPVLCVVVAGLPPRVIVVRVALVLPFAALLGAASPSSIACR